ncbi:MAG: hypothetical protein QW677_07675 [Pyrobaculum sp.]|uniref:Uncharacterized protein n=1 Tax=Pyrobaculum arsenaticum TaxID=121277 RepID=A0A7L4P9L2_9CREN|nr:hypothetical protein [Pyrobaculum arsenaticum]NYR15304.1 hypothetical protein [Pyrobaculum arsenaticum]
MEKLLGFVREMLTHVGGGGGQEYYWRISSGNSANAFSDEKIPPGYLPVAVSTSTC